MAEPDIISPGHDMMFTQTAPHPSVTERAITKLDIDKSANPQTLYSQLQAMENYDLLALRENLGNDDIMRQLAASSPPALTALIGTVSGAVTIAISQPLARLSKITDKSFKSYMRHPASIAFIGYAAMGGFVDQFIHRSEVREMTALRLIDRILEQRGVPVPKA